jgi:hypothetical protein
MKLLQSPVLFDQNPIGMLPMFAADVCFSPMIYGEPVD